MNFLKMKIKTSFNLLVIIASMVLLSQCKNPASLNALLISDSAPVVSSLLKTVLENSGLFDVDIQKGNSYSFTNYDVVVLNLEKAAWSDEVIKDFEAYVSNGGGLVLLGGSVSAFENWNGASNMFGIETDGQLRKSTKPYTYLIANADVEHPVTHGLQKKWLHGNDYMIYNTGSLKEGFEVLASAKADTAQGGNGMVLPVISSGTFGEGRIFNSTLGFAPIKDHIEALQCVGFITTLQRGAEWAATGVVSQEVPVEFPNSVSVHLWPKLKPLTVDEILEKASAYEIGKSTQYLTDFSMRVRNSDGTPESYSMYESKILAFLASTATSDSKKYMCRELSWIGSEKSIPELQKLVNDKDLSESATFALQRLR
jgi:uncharacterized protein